MKMRNKIITMGSIAAALAVMIAVAALAMGVDRNPPPDVLAQPIATDTPVQEDSTIVHCNYGAARFYHKTVECNGLRNNRELTLQEARQENLSPCPDCYGQTDPVLYYTPQGNYYHVDPDCCGMTGAEPHSADEAIINSGKRHCPVCFDTDEEKDIYLLPAPQTADDEVYIAATNSYYHRDPDCFEDMVLVSKMDLASAAGFGKSTCPVCLAEKYYPSLPETCYATENGKYYHSDPNCSGMQNATFGTTVWAQATGKQRCPVCMQAEPEYHELFTTAFGRPVSGIYDDCIYDHSVKNGGSTQWYVSNGTDMFVLCTVYPKGTVSWVDQVTEGDYGSDLPELELTGLSHDRQQAHDFLASAPEPIGSMYAAVPALIQECIEKGQADMTGGDLYPQRVTVFFDADNRVRSCEMLFGFSGGVRLSWKVHADGQIELTESEFISSEWDDSSGEETAFTLIE